MSADNPRWNDQGSSGLSITFENISHTYQLAKGKAVKHGEMSQKEARRDNDHILVTNKTFFSLAVAEGSISVNDLAIRDIEVDVYGGYSPRNGEWINVLGSINLVNEKVESRFAENINRLEGELEEITGRKWNIEGEALNEIGRLPLHVGLARKDEDDPEDYPSIYVATKESNMTEGEFIQESERLRKVISHVVSFVYQSMGYQSRPLSINVENNMD